MAKYFQLSIPEPCQEKWSDMSATQEGRFCSSCSKSLVDFSSMSDDALIAYFKKRATGTVCGRFSNTQLQTDFLIPQRKIPWLKYFFQVALPGFLFSAKAISQPNENAIISRTENSATVELPTVSKEVLIPNIINDTIRGRVTDTLGNPIPVASIQILGTKLGTMADEAGYFQLNTNEYKSGTLQISCIGYESKQIKFNDSVSAFAEVQLKAYDGGYEVVGVIVAVRKKQKRKPVPPLIPTTMEVPHSTFRLYPNPLSAGSSLNMELTKVEEGYYFIDLTSQTGLSVYQKKIWIDNNAKVINFDIPILAAGIYFVALRQKDNSKGFSQQLLIQ